MRTAVMADVHANLEALRAVLERIHALKVDEVVCLGDLVGYNANPEECVDVLRRENVVCILGNHDAAAAGMEEPVDFNPFARSAVFWTRGRLSDESKRFLRGLPRGRNDHERILFHGWIHDTNRYLLYREDAMANFRLLDELTDVGIGFFGHTHVATAVSEHHGEMTVESPGELLLSPGKRYLINPGSIGQPRDGDPRAAFLIYDTEDKRITFHRVAYDIQTTQGKIIRAGLPALLSERLSSGR